MLWNFGRCAPIGVSIGEIGHNSAHSVNHTRQNDMRYFRWQGGAVHFSSCPVRVCHPLLRAPNPCVWKKTVLRVVGENNINTTLRTLTPSIAPAVYTTWGGTQ